jgi:hypothetical protein
VRQDARVRTRLATPVAVLALAGCGGGSSNPSSTVGTPQPAGPKGLLYTGTTSQRQPVRIEATSKLFGTIKLQLDCKDGSSSRVTLSTGPTRPRPTLESDGSFYYEEDGRTSPREFPGFGAGRYRGAMDGTIVGPKGSGHAAFRITFKETNCRAAVSWGVKRGG